MSADLGHSRSIFDHWAPIQAVIIAGCRSAWLTVTTSAQPAARGGFIQRGDDTVGKRVAVGDNNPE